MRARSASLGSLPFIACWALAVPAQAQASLPSYSIDAATVTIAGVSSGGFMAVQMHVAFSSKIHGAAIFAGGPFYCAQDSLGTAAGACESGSGLSLQTFVGYTSNEVAAGAIDSTSNLSGQPVYLFSGTDDHTVHQATMNVLQQYYANYSANVTYDNNTAADHGWISPDGPNGCDTSLSPYINNCSIDPEQTFLTMFYGALTAKNTGTLGGSFVQFDQAPFCAGGSCSALSLDSTGWLFVPQGCASGQACKLVVALHGCEQSQSAVGEDFVKESGLDEWADTNAIVVLYPQAMPTSPSNPQGCWDWWGYTGASYALQSGPQMQTLLAMIDQVTAGVASGSSGGSSVTASSTSGSSGGASSTGGSSNGGSSSGTGANAGASTGSGGGTTSPSGSTGAASSAGSSGGSPLGTRSSSSNLRATGGSVGSQSGGCDSARGAESWFGVLLGVTLLRRRGRGRRGASGTGRLAGCR